jgi:hypothetical protein
MKETDHMEYLRTDVKRLNRMEVVDQSLYLKIQRSTMLL